MKLKLLLNRFACYISAIGVAVLIITALAQALIASFYTLLALITFGVFCYFYFRRPNE